MSKIPVSVQLYTLRDSVSKDFAGTLKQLKEIGLGAVELAGFGNLKTAAEVRKVLDDLGMKASGMHVAIEVMEQTPDQALEDMQVLGCRNMICPWMHEVRRADAAGWKKVAGILNTAGARANERGLIYSYHNHDFEFKNFDGKTGMDILIENTDPRLVHLELDVYWVKRGGLDPVSYIKQLGNRIALLHLKDISPDNKFAPVGTGLLDFPAIVAAGVAAGAKWGVIEQDDCYNMTPLDSVRTSFNNLKAKGLI